MSVFSLVKTKAHKIGKIYFKIHLTGKINHLIPRNPSFPIFLEEVRICAPEISEGKMRKIGEITYIKAINMS